MEESNQFLGYRRYLWLKVLMDLATSARSEKVRFDAAKDLLDRAGFKPVERILSLTQDTPDLSPEQLRDRATQLLQDIFDDGPEAVVERLNSNPVPAQVTDHDTPMSPNC